MKERPILFSGPMVRAILEGRKTQARRVADGSLAFYRLLDDRIECIHRGDEDIDRCYFEADSRLSKLGLYGGQRWPDLFENQICRIWAEGARGLVSAERSQQREGLPVRFLVSREPKGNQISSQAGLHGVSRVAAVKNTPSSSSGRNQIQQRSFKSRLGDTGRELGGSCYSWSRDGGRETSRIKIDRRREIVSALGNLNGLVQPKEGCQMPWDVPIGNLADHKWQVGRQLWVRETFRFDGLDEQIGMRDKRLDEINYRADMDGDRSIDDCPWRPSIHMPRWASRITLEIESVRVERLQEISPDDCRAEGMPADNNDIGVRYGFGQLWQSIHGPRSWDANPWVWVIEFKRLEGLR